ncbi:hypothetical protein JWH11_03205 [Xanthomonas melonis]|uniref:Uncharacterized protein n=1 Tax=Xanthomonas melonis TaxID=56456 RepID=A0ABS8NR52_9XANT|nr:hypothetical protein [Xanthomonas melonis]MCD0245716.1 hypothetical protein [Xanthomonas melonis]MCD0257256.1 hypothetical protein [Xanthomonas melonis]MCD0265458.1 hypothetical protein [Xanthomonas melonis]MCD0280106.1 hypothetical protein [Xanthomonas melonis]
MFTLRTHLAIFAGLAAAYNPASALAETLRCDGCTNYEMESEAIMAAAHNNLPYYTPVYVIDGLRGGVKKYYVSLEQPGQDVPDQLPDGSNSYGFAIEDPAEAPIHAYISLAFRTASESISFSGGGGGPNSAYDLTNNPSNQQAVANHIRSTRPALIQDAISTLTAINPFGSFNPDKMAITVRVNLPDGTRAYFVFDQRLKDWVKLDSQSRDSNSNIIPENRNDLTGGPNSFRQYIFSNPNDLTRFVQRASELGAAFQGNVGTGTSMTCTSNVRDAGNGEIRAEVVCSATH